VSASNSQKKPTSRKMNPRMSATPAKVSSGEIIKTTPATKNSTPNIQRIHRAAPPTNAPNKRFCSPASMNMNPIITPTSVIEDPSNWTTTSATTTQKVPAISRLTERISYGWAS
jgi:hypothetical protein